MQIDHFNSEYFKVQGDHCDNNEDGGQTQCINADNSEDESYDELNSSRQLNDMKSNKLVNQENQISTNHKTK